MNEILKDTELYYAWESAVRTVKTDPTFSKLSDIDNRIQAAKEAMDHIAERCIGYYVEGLVESGIPCHVMTALKSVVHHHLHMMESDEKVTEVTKELFEKSILKHKGAWREALAKRNGFCEMFADLIQDNEEIRDRIEKQNSEAEGAKRALIITILQAAEAGYKTTLVQDVWNEIRKN